ncbi:hypothetical protein V1511DRAFT_507446 [Dipodascopsis uninucleata]
MKWLHILELGVAYAIGIRAIEIDQELTASRCIAKADVLLSHGDFQDAVDYYDAAVKKDPVNYLSVFKRGAAYLSMGRANAAMSDFDRALDIKPDFDSALIQRGRLRLRMGDFKGAKSDFMLVTSGAADVVDENIKMVEESETDLELAEAAYSHGYTTKCIIHSSKAINNAPLFNSLRELRAKCRLAEGQISECVADLAHVVNNNHLSSFTYVEMAMLQYFYLNEREKAIDQLARCLHYDPDAKNCKRAFRELKSLNKRIKQAVDLRNKKSWSAFEKAVLEKIEDSDHSLLDKINEYYKDMIASHAELKKSPKKLREDLLESICEAFVELKAMQQGSIYCSEVLRDNPNSESALFFKGQEHLKNDEFEEAVQVLNHAKDVSGGRNQKILNLLHEANMLLKRSKSKDYYKVLDVSRTATDKEIKKAYREKTKEFHPDKYRGNLKLEQVEKKMAEINEAYEVLSNSESRSQFDSGNDPNDHTRPDFEGAHQGGFNPFFQQGFHQGGSQQFFRQGGRQQFYSQGRRSQNFHFRF